MPPRACRCTATAIAQTAAPAKPWRAGCLLRQPHGFEGLLSSEVAPVQDDPPVAEPKHQGPLLHAYRTALRSARSNTAQREYRIVGVDQLVELVLKLIEDLGGEPEQGPNPVVATVCSGHERTRIYHEHDLGVDLCPQRLAGLVPVVGEAANALHVLLRHRPPSIARV